ncbi:MAG: hypothetical protein HYZ08_01930, partial [Candidatus Kerfeldbacteria bacterium]|nr:hypothetical protein [Candidatus Kerfeldbacteria bacterium]
GAIGTLGLGMLLIAPLVALFRSSNGSAPMHLRLLCSASITLIIAAFSVPFSESLMIVYWMIAGVLWSQYRSVESPISLPLAGVGIFFGVLILLIAATSVISVQTLQADRFLSNFRATENDSVTQALLEQSQQRLAGSPTSSRNVVEQSRIIFAAIQQQTLPLDQGTQELEQQVRVMSQQFGRDPLVQLEAARLLTELRELQSERKYDADIGTLLGTLLSLAPENPFLPAQVAQNIATRIRWDVDHGWLPTEERDDATTSIVQALALVNRSEVLFSGTRSFSELRDELNALLDALSSTPDASS